MGNDQSKPHGDAPPPYSSDAETSSQEQQLPSLLEKGARNGYTSSSREQLPSLLEKGARNSYTPSPRYFSGVSSDSSRINNQHKAEARRPRPDIEMSVRPGEAVEEIKEAQRTTNETLAKLVIDVGKLAHEAKAKDRQLSETCVDLAREKEERLRERWEAKEREDAWRAMVKGKLHGAKWEAKGREDALIELIPKWD